MAKKESEKKKQQTKNVLVTRQQKSKSRKKGHPEVWKEAMKHPKNTRQSKIVDLGDWKIKHALIN